MDILMYLIAGLLAGIATGLVGLSAATIIAPLFATFLGIPVYQAIGIALASDVFASANSARIYYVNKNINIKKSILFAIVVISFTIIGSYFSKDMNPYNLNSIINGIVIFLGIRFIVYPVKSRSAGKRGKFILTQTIFWGMVIGLINGYFGSGGGLSILAVLTMLLGYGLKEAIGTSVLIMTFTAFVGAATHIAIGGTIWIALLITSVGAFIGAQVASKYANRISEVKLNRVIGSFLIIYGICLVVSFFIQN